MEGWIRSHTLDDSEGMKHGRKISDCLLRLYSKGRVLGHKRAKRNTRPNTSLIQIEGVATKEDAQFYLGKVRSTDYFTFTVYLT